jgi:hypothetical protein
MSFVTEFMASDGSSTTAPLIFYLVRSSGNEIVSQWDRFRAGNTRFIDSLSSCHFNSRSSREIPSFRFSEHGVLAFQAPPC